MMKIGRAQFLRAWRLAGFANHQWSFVPWDDLLAKRVGDLRGQNEFGAYFDGLTARQWVELAEAMTYLHTQPGPVGWGIVGPGADDEGNLIVWIGAGVEAVFSAEGRYSISYRNPRRGVEITAIMPFRRFNTSGPVAPRDWARVVRLSQEAEGGLDLISDIVPKEVRGSREYQEYLSSRNAGHLLVGPVQEEEAQ